MDIQTLPVAPLNPVPRSPIRHILEWRAKHPEEYAIAKIEGLRNSPKVKAAAREVARKYNPINWEKLKKRRQFQATVDHIRALEWSLVTPDGVRYEFKNLANFIRENQALFQSEDLVWSRVGNGVRCRAYAGLVSLRPDRKRVEGSWRGWRWAI